MSMLAGTQSQSQQPASQQQATQEQVEPSQVMSTTDALAALRLRRKEESKSSGSTKATTLQQYESLAAPFEEYVPEVVEAKMGKCGKTLSKVFH